MARNEAVVDSLHAHVLGLDTSPTATLLDRGELPNGWLAEYLRLVEIARTEWGSEPMWPSALVTAIHFASWYLPIRYDAWRTSTGKRNERTERELAGIRSPSETFLMSGLRTLHM